jgi:hypothetical protein
VGYLLKMALDLPHIVRREPPIVVPKVGEVSNRVPCYPPGTVNVGIIVTHHKVAHGTKDRLATVQPYVARPRYGAAPVALLIKKEDVIEFVLRFDADQKRGVAVLFEDSGGN